MSRSNRIRLWLSISAVLMIVGHWVIIGSGAYYQPAFKEPFDLYKNWVSDFAGRWPDGLWIKASIVFFCVAIAEFFSGLIRYLPQTQLAGLLNAFWILLGTVMIGGLGLVIFCDMLPYPIRVRGPQFVTKHFGAVFGYHYGERSESEWIMRWWHSIGFGLFVGGFIASVVGLAWFEWRSKNRSAAVAAAVTLFVVAVMEVWLFATNTPVPGIPQRLLLLLIFFWMLSISSGSEAKYRKRQAVPVSVD